LFLVWSRKFGRARPAGRAVFTPAGISELAQALRNFGVTLPPGLGTGFRPALPKARRPSDRLQENFAAWSRDLIVVGLYPSADRAERGVALDIGALAHNRGHGLHGRQLAGTENMIAGYSDGGVRRPRQ